MRNKLITIVLTITFLWQNCLWAAMPAPQYLRQMAVAERGAKKAGPGSEMKMPLTALKETLNVLLVVPPMPYERDLKPMRLPYNLMGLASCLRDRKFILQYVSRKYAGLQIKESDLNINVRILDLQAEGRNFDFENFLKQNSFDIIGFAAVTPVIEEAKRLAGICKRSSPQAILIAGGVHVTALPFQTLKGSVFDIAATGEADETIVDLALWRLFGKPRLPKIEGIYYKDPATRDIIQNSPRQRVMSLAEYPLPARSLSLLNMSGYANTIDIDGIDRGVAGTMVTSRGCVDNCNFCASHLIFGRRIEFRPAQQVFEEIRLYYMSGMRNFYFYDDNFTFNRTRILELAGLIRDSNIKINYFAITRADFIDEETAKALCDSGCQIVNIGVESGDQRLLDNVINKRLRLEKIEKATAILKRYGIHVKWYMMVGLPTQDWESIELSRRFILRCRPDSVDVAIVTPYPGTALAADKRMRILEEAGFSDFWHKADARTLDAGRQSDVITKTDVMSPGEITAAREFINWASVASKTGYSELKTPLLDRVIALMLLPFTALTIAFLAPLIKLTSKGPVFFKYAVVGHQAKRIVVWKLRTMTNEGDPEKHGVTFIGKLIRPIGLDELPQLFSVLKGDMQLTGPRPYPPELMSDDYVKEILSRTLPGFGCTKAVKKGVGAGGRAPASNSLADDLHDINNRSFVYNLQLWIKIFEKVIYGLFTKTIRFNNTAKEKGETKAVKTRTRPKANLDLSPNETIMTGI